MPTLRERHAALLDEMKAIAAKATDEKRDFTDDEVTRINEIEAEFTEVDAKVKAADEAQATAAAMAGREKLRLPGEAKGPNAPQFDPMAQAFTHAIAARGMVDGAKSVLPTSGSVTIPVDIGDVQLPYALNGIAGLIGRDDLPGGSDTFGYMRQVTRVHNAATVQIGGQKPTSVYALDRITGRVMTIAHLSEEIPKQWLADLPTLQDFITAEMTAGIQLKAHVVLLDGGTAENGDDEPGVLTTTGVLEQEFVTDPLVTARKAITTMQTAGEEPTGWVFNPTDWETIDLLRDAQDRFLLPGGPGQRGTLQLWSVPVALDPGLEAGSGLLGDWRTVQILTRQGVRVDWSEAGELFERNKVKFRAEARIGVAIKRPGALARIELTDAGGGA